MEIRYKRLQGRTILKLRFMDREIRKEEHPGLVLAVRKLRKKIQSTDGAEVPTLTAGGSEIIEIDGMMFWVNCRQKTDGPLNVFVSSRRKPI